MLICHLLRLLTCFRVRAVWDAFISLTERKQIEILGSLPYQRSDCLFDSEEEEELESIDGSRPRQFDKNAHNAAAASGRQRSRRQKGRPRQQHRRKPLVRLEDSLPDAEPFGMYLLPSASFFPFHATL
ncbi:unnamed protein product [Dibothriocephalus latus]|uniref:Uncharacterized protein n=1 Tax=Dibothriocephalus latus TaxID=60516 RepID=A0A3P7MBG9_DIBLA|nr:unnamed protein product [Dibothriocephalus latus]